MKNSYFVYGSTDNLMCCYPKKEQITFLRKNKKEFTRYEKYRYTSKNGFMYCVRSFTLTRSQVMQYNKIGRSFKVGS